MLVGWCAYYFIFSCTHANPADEILSRQTWDNLQVMQKACMTESDIMPLVQLDIYASTSISRTSE